MIKAVISDIDGTLVDSVDLNAHAWLARVAFKATHMRSEFQRAKKRGGVTVSSAA